MNENKTMTTAGGFPCKWPMTFSTSPRPMKTRQGETRGEPLIASNSARGDARPPKTRIFIGAATLLGCEV